MSHAVTARAGELCAKSFINDDRHQFALSHRTTTSSNKYRALLESESQNIRRNILRDARRRLEPPRLPEDLIRPQEVFPTERRVHLETSAVETHPAEPAAAVTDSATKNLPGRLRLQGTPVYVATRGLAATSLAGVTDSFGIQRDQSEKKTRPRRAATSLEGQTRLTWASLPEGRSTRQSATIRVARRTPTGRHPRPRKQLCRPALPMQRRKTSHPLLTSKGN